jgi:hypothetical protein
VLEGDPETIAGGLGYRFLPGPGNQEVVVTFGLLLGQGFLLAVGQDVADQSVGVVATGMTRAAG